MYPYYYDENRQGFVLPFLVGAVTGGAAIGLTRPRPIVNQYPAYSQPYYNQPYYSAYYSSNYPYNPYYYR